MTGLADLEAHPTPAYISTFCVDSCFLCELNRSYDDHHEPRFLL